jgi:hypothetical protein
MSEWWMNESSVGAIPGRQKNERGRESKREKRWRQQTRAKKAGLLLLSRDASPVQGVGEKKKRKKFPVKIRPSFIVSWWGLPLALRPFAAASLAGWVVCEDGAAIHGHTEAEQEGTVPVYVSFSDKG